MAEQELPDPFPFATLEELRQRWPDMPPGADAHAELLLEDASYFILDVCPSAADASENARRRVVCAVVRRSMEAQQSPGAGSTQFQATTGPFTTSFQPANPHGDFYLTKMEKKSLGCGAQRAFGRQVAFRTGRNLHRPWCSLAWGAYCSCGADLTDGEGPLWEA